jgi:hypothetical protein
MATSRQAVVEDAGAAAAGANSLAELRRRAARFLPGTMVCDQPIIPAPIPLRFPFPAFATSVGEAGDTDPEAAGQAADDAFAKAAGRVVR